MKIYISITFSIILLATRFIYIRCTDELLLPQKVASFMRLNGDVELQNRFYSLKKSKVENIYINAEHYLNRFAEKLEDKTKLANSKLQELSNELIKMEKEERLPQNCCDVENTDVDYKWQVAIDKDNFCEMVKPSTCHTISSTEHLLFKKISIKEKFAKIFNDLSEDMTTRYLFYGDEEKGTYIQFPAMKIVDQDLYCKQCGYDPRLRSWYTESISPKHGKDVVITIHASKATSSETLEKLINSTHIILDTLDARDQVVLKLIHTSGVTYPNSNSQSNCLSALVPSTPHVIQELELFLQDLPKILGDKSSLQNVFKKSFEDFNNTDINREKVLFVLTDSSSPFENDINGDGDIIDAILEGNTHFANNKTFIMILSVAENIDTDNKGKFGDIAKQKCGISSADPRCNNIKEKDIPLDVDIKNQGSGKFKQYDSEEDVRKSIGKFYNMLVSEKEKTLENNARFTLPYFDFNGLDKKRTDLAYLKQTDGGRMIDACKPIYKSDDLLGVTCISFLSKELLNFDETFENSLDSYVFLIDEQGTTYKHPKFEEPILDQSKAFPINIRKLEPSKEFQSIYDAMMRGENGNETLSVNVSIPTGNALGASRFQTKQYRYVWRKIDSSPFTMAVVVSKSYETKLKLDIETSPHNQKTLYHRFNLPKEDVCIHPLASKDSYATETSSVVSFAPDLYKQPSIYYKQETPESVEKLMNYFDNKDIVMNWSESPLGPVTARSVRQTVIATNAMDDIWKNIPSDYVNNTFFMYVGLENGMFRSYPGHNMHAFYDPRIRPWYQLARGSSEKYVITSPYHDFTTDALIITIATKIFLTNETNQVAGVLALDSRLPWLERQIKEEQGCTEKYRCLIIDKSGYLVYTENLEDLHSNSISSKFHITETEPLLANDLFTRGYMLKTHCIGYHKLFLNDAVPRAHYQRFYSLGHIFGIKDHRDSRELPCLKYKMTSIKNTNLFLIHYYENNCDKNQQNTCTCFKNQDNINVCQKDFIKGCECPCYDFKICEEDFKNPDTTLLCQPPDFRLDKKLSPDRRNTWQQKYNICSLKRCMDPKCHQLTDDRKCYARSGCIWCNIDTNGYELQNKTCSNEFFCQNNKRSSPYESCKITTTTTTTIKPLSRKDDSNTSLIVGVVIGICLFLFIVAGILYKSYPYIKKKLNKKDQYNDERKNNNLPPPPHRRTSYEYRVQDYIDEPTVVIENNGVKQPHAKSNDVGPLQNESHKVRLPLDEIVDEETDDESMSQKSTFAP